MITRAKIIDSAKDTSFGGNVAKRLRGIARHWQRTFHLPYDMVDDLMQSAWVLWLERPTVETERRFQQVSCAVRNVVLREIYGKMPSGGKVTGPAPLFVSSEFIGSYATDFDGHVRLGEIAKACVDSSTDHKTTLAMISGVGLMTNRKKNFKNRCNRLHRFLAAKGLAA